MSEDHSSADYEVEAPEPSFKRLPAFIQRAQNSLSAVMFSPEATPPSHGHSLRPKRSRLTGSDDSIKLPRAKRRRSALRRDTFEPLSDLSPNEVAVGANSDITIDGHPPEHKSDHNVGYSAPKELTFRAAKKADKRGERGGGAMVLVSAVLVVHISI